MEVVSSHPRHINGHHMELQGKIGYSHTMYSDIFSVWIIIVLLAYRVLTVDFHSID